MTALDLLARAIRAKADVSGAMERPAAILWPDANQDWHRLLPAVRSRIPELLVLGDYRPDDRTGPAIWLRCVIDGRIQLPDVPGERPPVVYLPGIERGQLHAGEDCPEVLRPLVELLYRGVAWHHSNGRDWSARAFLTLRADGVPAGPGLDIAGDSETREALLRAIGEVAQTPLEELRGRRLDANAFNRIAGVEIERDILRWLGNPEVTRQTMGDRWDAFRDQALRALRFDPEAGSDVEAGAKLAEGKGRWRYVWSRFGETPESFPGVADVLRRSRPEGELVLEGRERWPDLNDEDEMALRAALVGLPQFPQPAACAEIERLEAEHGPRRAWIWAKLGDSPLAKALRPLALLAEAAGKSVGGATPDDIVRVYSERGWQADRSAREALAFASPTHEQLIADTVRHLAEPWMDESARAFQAAVRDHPLPSVRTGAVEAGLSAADAETRHPIAAAENECLLFVDGLRYELGCCLAERLRDCGLTANVRSRWAAIPTVTATAKPAVTPVADRIAGDRLGADFQPVMRRSGRPAVAATLREAIRERGYEIVGDGTLDLGPPPGARGWLETGKIDHHGHHHDAAGFARLVEAELDRIARRVLELIEAGWASVRIVTDHGWLLLPGGLPMVTLPGHLTASKWARAAVLAEDARPDAPLHPWHWNPDERFASPHGIACFSKRPEYAHGGLSVQECLIPDIRVRAAATDGRLGRAGLARTVIRSVSWLRMRCNILVEAPPEGAAADLRLGTPSGESVASSPKPIDADGCASLILRDDAHEDAALVLVVTASDGHVLAHRNTRTGDPPA
ncbi:MAG: BREX-1 system phosphatase PglZ type B [Gammaproteobacteria bacterium]|nr:BREX-1 system phosphatase PglZ type B [Gammaproteobacteria bacterium]